jgi:ankyrin repeat protein
MCNADNRLQDYLNLGKKLKPSLEHVKNLIASGAPIDLPSNRDSMGRDSSPLFTAIRLSGASSYWSDPHSQKVAVEIALYLIESGADVNRYRYSHDSEKGVNGHWRHFQRKQTPLMEAVQVILSSFSSPNPMGDNPDLVLALLEAGAEINAIDERGQTAIMKFCQHLYSRDFESVLTTLIDWGADMHLMGSRLVNSWKDSENLAANAPNTLDLEEIIEEVKEGTLLTLFLDQQPGWNAFIEPSFIRSINRADDLGSGSAQLNRIVSKLINSGIDINAKDNQGNTALHYAAQYYNTELIQLLINSGANVHAENNHGLTPLFFASRNLDPGIMISLIDIGADVNARDIVGQTPLMYVARFCSYEPSVDLISALLDSGADILAKSVHVSRPEEGYAKRLLNRGITYEEDLERYEFYKVVDKMLMPISNSGTYALEYAILTTGYQWEKHNMFHKMEKILFKVMKDKLQQGG